MDENNHNSSSPGGSAGNQNSVEEEPRLVSSNRPPSRPDPSSRDSRDNQNGTNSAPSASQPSSHPLTGGVENGIPAQDESLNEGQVNSASGIDGSVPPAHGGPTSSLAVTPNAIISPGDTGSVVNATPVPLTPGPHRRELGVSPVRLTPQSLSAAPGSPRHSQAVSPGTPTNGTQEALVLWGTTVNMEDTEQRLTSFLTCFRMSTATGSSHEGSRGDASQESRPLESGENISADQEGARNPSNSGNDTTEKRAPDLNDESPPFYMDVLQHLADTGDSVLNVNMSHLHQYDPGLYRKIRAYPNELITVFDAIVTSVFKEKFPAEAEEINENRRKSLQVRTYDLLNDHVQSMRELNPSDISSLVAVRGMIIRASSIIPDIQVAMYSCSKCRSMKDVRISHGRIDEPRKCHSCNTRDSFTLIHSRSTFSDKQMVRLQEAPETVPKGETPATFTLVMYDSLVDAVKPGDRVEVTGILRATPVRVNPKLRVVRSVFRTYIDCVHIRTLNNNQMRLRSEPRSSEKSNGSGQSIERSEGDVIDTSTTTRYQEEARQGLFETLACHPRLYDRLSASVAPSIFGMDDEKKGILLQLFGGASKKRQSDGPDSQNSTDTATVSRSSINILLVGDPGTSKSQLLHSAHRLAPRGVYTSGRGSSAVGLTAYVTRDPDSDDYVLESGALVLSDGGVCCIDEFDKMSDFARSVLHEAMEQQTVSIAKAGIIATLNARTAVLAAANPVNSRYDTSKSVVDNIDLPPTLLSRFDLIYLVLDAPNAGSDRKLARHIVSLFFKNYDDKEGASGSSRKNELQEADDLTDPSIPNAPAYGMGDLLDARTLTDYIAYARKTVNPCISDPAADALVNAYVDMRAGGRGTANMTATPRQLESLIRLAEAHAKMFLRETVEVLDVEEAVRLVKSALHMAAYDPNTGRIDMNLFAAGKSRGADSQTEALGQAIVEKLEIRHQGKDIPIAELLNKLRQTSDIGIGPGDFREALRRLQQNERIIMVNNGKSVRLAQVG